MKAKFVYETIGDVLKGKSEKEILSSMKDSSLNKLLIQSSKIGFLSGVKKALEMGINVHVENDFALRCASEKGYKDIIKLLKKYEKEES